MKTIVLFATAASFRTRTITNAQATGDYFPNWAAGASGPHVCFLDDGSRTVPDSAPLFSSLEECCSTHYGWNLSECLGNGPSLEYFPNWGASPDVCLRDDGTRSVPAGAPLYSDLSACCANQYYWNLRECNNVELGPSNKYFPNWQRTPHVCLLDDGTNDIPAGAPFFDDLASCCAMHYPFNSEECNRGAPVVPSTASPSTSPTTLSPTTSGLRGATNSPITSAPVPLPSTSPPSAPTTDPKNWTAATQTLIKASDEGENDLYGRRVDIHGDLFIVGAYQDDNIRGSAYIYQRNSTNGNWEEVQKLVASDGGDHFGINVAISDTVAVVGATSNDGRRGAAYVFERSNTGNWVEVAKLVAIERNPLDFFGNSVSVDKVNGNTIVVGARGNEGAAYIYERRPTGDFSYRFGNWVLVNDLPSEFDSDLGWDVAVHGDIVAIGDRGYTNDTGIIYIYERVQNAGWVQTAEIVASDGETDDEFGSAVSLYENGLVVGAPLANSTGSVYVFERINGNWTEMAKVTASDGGSGDRFGTDISISGNSFIAGAHNNNINDRNFNAGAAYIFSNVGGNWTEQAKLVAFDRASNDRFGEGVSISGQVALVGAPGDDIGGSVYVIS